MKKFTYLFALMLIAFSYSAKADKVDDIISANIKAHGGEKAYKSVKSYYAEVDMSVMGMNIPVKMWNQSPDKSRIEQEAMGSKTIVVSNGLTGWVDIAGKIQDLTPEELGQQKLQNPIGDIIGNNPLIDYKTKKIQITYAGSEDVNGKACDILEIKQSAEMTIKWYIDKSTNLELKYKLILKMPEQAEASEDAETAEMMAAMMQPEIFVTEWMTVGGIKMPKSTDMKTGMGNMTMTYKKFDINPSIDAKLFEKPAADAKK